MAAAGAIDRTTGDIFGGNLRGEETHGASRVRYCALLEAGRIIAIVGALFKDIVVFIQFL